jgi:hypothetical protein
MLLMLEDNVERLQRFTGTLRRIDPGLPLRVWRNAYLMIEEMGIYLPTTRIISLDHDLDAEEGSQDDPGTGWELAKVLAALPPICPVIIHTSNGERATWMSGEFELGGWKCYRVPPLGDDWIEKDWRRMVRRLLKQRTV